jgi:membrane fusion protein (multidrug efflux system)
MPETVLASITENAAIDIVVPALNEKKVIASVIAIEPLVDVATRSVMVRARVDNKNGLLRPGLFARVLLPLKVAENILWLPEAALFLNGDKKLVLVNDDGKALRKEVVVISYQHGKIAISQGLSASDEVVIAGHHKAPFDGMPLMVVNPPAAVEKTAPSESATTEQIQQ